MPEKLLDRPKVGTAVEQMGRTGVRRAWGWRSPFPVPRAHNAERCSASGGSRAPSHGGREKELQDADRPFWRSAGGAALRARPSWPHAPLARGGPTVPCDPCREPEACLHPGRGLHRRATQLAHPYPGCVEGLQIAASRTRSAGARPLSSAGASTTRKASSTVRKRGRGFRTLGIRSADAGLSETSRVVAGNDRRPEAPRSCGRSWRSFDRRRATRETSADRRPPTIRHPPRGLALRRTGRALRDRRSRSRRSEARVGVRPEGRLETPRSVAPTRPHEHDTPLARTPERIGTRGPPRQTVVEIDPEFPILTNILSRRRKAHRPIPRRRRPIRNRSYMSPAAPEAEQATNRQIDLARN